MIFEKQRSHPEFNKCYKELGDAFAFLIPKLDRVFTWIKNQSDQGSPFFPHLHLGYTVMKDESFDLASTHFPWLEKFRTKFKLRKRLNFLETNANKNTFMPHIDGRPESPQVMLNSPLRNCNEKTVTYWVQATQPFVPVKLAENGTTHLTEKGATPHLPEGTSYYIFNYHCFTTKPSLFRSDIYHGVVNNSQSGECRTMCHWWFQTGVLWDEAVKMFR